MSCRYYLFLGGQLNGDRRPVSDSAYEYRHPAPHISRRPYYAYSGEPNYRPPPMEFYRKRPIHNSNGSFNEFIFALEGLSENAVADLYQHFQRGFAPSAQDVSRRFMQLVQVEGFLSRMASALRQAADALNPSGDPARILAYKTTDPGPPIQQPQRRLKDMFDGMKDDEALRLHLNLRARKALSLALKGKRTPEEMAELRTKLGY